jgi:hypothetical protein
MNDPLESTMCDARWRRLVAVELIVLGFLLNRDTVDLMLALRGATEPLGWRLVVLAVQLAAIAGGLALLWQPGRRTRLRLAVAATALLLCAVFNVLFVQFFYRLPEKRAGWISHVPVEERNEFGFRGQPVDNGDGDFVILLVGDSQVEAVAVPLERMPERLLEAHLRELGRPARVFTLGARGYGQDQQLLMLEKYFEQRRADLILLWFTPGNDVWNNLFPTHWPANGQPKPTFWLENGGLRGPNHALGELLDHSPLKIVALWKRALARGQPKPDDAWEARLPAPYPPLSEHDGPVRDDWERLESTQFANENLATEKSHLAIHLTPPSPRMEYGLELTRQLLERIQSLAESNRARLALFYVDTPRPYLGDEPEVYRFKGRLYRASAGQGEANAARVTASFETHILPVTVPDWQVSEQDAHLNDTANDQVMRDLARRIAPLVPANRKSASKGATP